MKSTFLLTCVVSLVLASGCTTPTSIDTNFDRDDLIAPELELPDDIARDLQMPRGVRDKPLLSDDILEQLREPTFVERLRRRGLCLTALSPIIQESPALKDQAPPIMGCLELARIINAFSTSPRFIVHTLDFIGPSAFDGAAYVAMLIDENSAVRLDSTGSFEPVEQIGDFFAYASPERRRVIAYTFTPNDIVFTITNVRTGDREFGRGDHGIALDMLAQCPREVFTIYRRALEAFEAADPEDRVMPTIELFPNSEYRLPSPKWRNDNRILVTLEGISYEVDAYPSDLGGGDFENATVAYERVSLADGSIDWRITDCQPTDIELPTPSGTPPALTLGTDQVMGLTDAFRNAPLFPISRNDTGFEDFRVQGAYAIPDED